MVPWGWLSYIYLCDTQASTSFSEYGEHGGGGALRCELVIEPDALTLCGLLLPCGQEESILEERGEKRPRDSTSNTPESEKGETKKKTVFRVPFYDSMLFFIFLNIRVRFNVTRLGRGFGHSALCRCRLLAQVWRL